MSEIDRVLIHKGRGALGNEAGRFEPHQTQPFDDGWGTADEVPSVLETILQEDASRTIIARNQSPDISFDRSINPYRGCEHGCIYCYARPSHAYLGLSPGLDFESRLFFKPRAAELLAAELAKPGYQCAPMALGTNTDPYQPAERRKLVTRSILGVLDAWNHPVTIVTKGALIQRDIDILARMASRHLARVAVSVTTLDRVLARRMEPRAATPERRLATIEALAEAGIPTAVMAAPMIPGLNDHELDAILEAARDRGAVGAGYGVLRLPREIAELFQEWLQEHEPLKAAKILGLVRDMRQGELNDSRFGDRMRGVGPYADLLAQRFAKAIKRLGLDHRDRMKRLETSQFKAPPKAGDQLSLF